MQMFYKLSVHFDRIRVQRKSSFVFCLLLDNMLSRSKHGGNVSLRILYCIGQYLLPSKTDACSLYVIKNPSSLFVLIDIKNTKS